MTTFTPKNTHFKRKLVAAFVAVSFFSDLMVPKAAKAESVTSTILGLISGINPTIASMVNKIESTSDFPNALTLAKERPRRVMYVTVTAYSSTPDQTDDTPFITARGTHVRDGIIAANFLRFGTRVRFPDKFGEKEFVVEDRMHQRFSDRADIWMETREEAKQFGIRRLKMEIF